MTQDEPAGDPSEEEPSFPPAVRLEQALADLTNAVARSGREQFRANALTEARQGQVEALLEEMRRDRAARQRELERLERELAGAREQATHDLVRRLLPALDGLDQAISTARSAAAEGGASRWRWWRRAWSPTGGVGQAWVAGLEGVRQRFLGVLAAVGVTPVRTLGARFDPERHHAVEAVPAGEGVVPGSVVEEVRRGYLAGDLVLRWAEVVVARAAGDPAVAGIPASRRQA